MFYYVNCIYKLDALFCSFLSIFFLKKSSLFNILVHFLSKFQYKIHVFKTAARLYWLRLPNCCLPTLYPDHFVDFNQIEAADFEAETGGEGVCLLPRVHRANDELH